MTQLHPIPVSELQQNVFTAIGKEWMLITAETEKDGKPTANTMTASWGGAGVFWGKPAVTCYIRPQRYTKEFVDKEELFSVSFLKDGHRDALKLCGSVSGRDHDKIKEAGLTPVFIDGVPAFEEADTILICRKMYRTSMNPADFIDKDADSKFYPEKDYHDMYIAEIVKAVVAE